MDKYQVTFETWNKIAALYQEKFMTLDLYNDSYDQLCELLPLNNAKLLEVGCGPGNITHYLLSKRPEIKITATDVAPNMVALAQKNNPTAIVELMDARAIASLNMLFDGIVCGFCLPYLSKEDVMRFFSDCYSMLTKNGVFYFSVIAGDYAQSGYEAGSTGDKSYVYYYSESFLTKLLAENKFELLKIFRKAYTTSSGRDTVHLLFLARKGE